MHPPFALPFERVVPEGGITVLGHYVPAGTNLGGSPYVVNRHKGTFGQDAEFWRPERWLEKDEKHKLKLERRILTVSLISREASVSVEAILRSNLNDLVRCWTTHLLGQAYRDLGS